MDKPDKHDADGGWTIADVARRAGVSIRTVSRVINRSSLVNADTRKKVEQIIAQLHFHPSARARGLRTGRSYLIGLLHNDRNALVLGAVQRGIARVAAKHGYELVVHPTPDSDDNAIADISQFVSRSKVDGVIVMPPDSGAPGLPQSLAGAGVSAVALSAVPLHGYAAILVSEERAAARDVGLHLMALGHRHVGLVSGPHSAHSAQERRAGLIEALAAGGIDLAGEAEGDYGFESGVAQTRRLLTSAVPPTAIFVSNDIMAAGALQAATELGLSVPRDVSIVGFDDSILARMLTPPITTVNRPMIDMAAWATTCLIDIIEGRPFKPTMSQALSLTIRASTAPPGR
ncbi:LacI family DNA-binding transcriptional regulator [Sphingobium sp. AP49]|uniref:LacI family DNA-binding transcriptional regulator n=1 Tax=Sphingobium sp. AP49 TaxID=1144307 RepID=UPI00026ECACD|nr:LacI family DNA-binding transcriptional regulator [Sphingobium sp. AP49]WHO37967.1 LacI family DNA-binding transcriptional regulator [Sphingobium sp. AP49]